MEKHIVCSYDSDLNKLRVSVINMASLVKELIGIAALALQSTNKSYVALADETDLKINHFDDEVEELSINLLALRQPMAVDLRNVISSLRLAVILERMGDLVKKISHRVEYLEMNLDDRLKKLMFKTISDVDRLLGDAIFSYEQKDEKLAIKISQEDHVIDQSHFEMMNILEREMQEKPQNIKELMNVVMVARNLERVGDYINKIANITHYIVTGAKIS
jgi:phosphate transport system protein